jgi:hypothetical protein
MLWAGWPELWGHPHDGTSSSNQLSCTVHLCLLASNTALFRAPMSESHYASQTCQICQLTNGRAGWPAEIQIKEGSPSCELSFNALVKYRAHQDNKKEETTPDCPATMPRGPGTTCLSTVPYLAAHSPATTSATATAIHHGPTTSQPCIECMPSPAADQTPLHHTVTLFSGCSQHRWGRPSDIATNLSNRAMTTVRHLRHQ